MIMKKNTADDESDCVLHAECEWHANAMTCGDAEDDRSWR